MQRISVNILGIRISFRNPFETSNNKIVLIKNGKEKRLHFCPAKIKFYGTDSCVEFYNKIPKLKNVIINLGNNSTVRFHESKYRIKNLKIDARADNILVDTGKDFSIESGSIDFHGEPNTKVIIGDDCQFGCDVELDTADGHTIFDENGNIINEPKDIIIGNHVWLCKNVSILKGTVIPDNCIAAKNSTLTKKYENTNRIIAGTPASQKEKYISWCREAVKNYNK